MKYKKYFVLLLIMMVVLLAGCTTDYERSDIEAYVQKNCPISHFSVSQAAEPVKDSDGYTDYLWTVEFQTRDGDKLTFHVLDDYYWGMESMSNFLYDDYDQVMLAYLYADFSATLLSLPAGSGEGPMADFVSLTGTFRDRDELRSLFDELDRFAGYAGQRGYDLDVGVDFQLDNPLRDRCAYVIDDGDFHRTLSLKNGAFPDRYEDALKGYLLTCLDYNFEDHLAQFTQAEIEAALDGSDQRIAISRGDEEGPWELYPDLGASKYSYGVSFGVLYEILVREGFDVEGDSWHYSFPGADGSVYEISYDFCGYPFEQRGGATEPGYYYLKDGEQIPMEYYFYNHFRAKQVLEMTGLILDFGRLKDLTQ